jgi:hypothetical protein
MTTKLTARQRDKLIEAAQNAVTFDVEGKGSFPIDMLRYDLCWPATGEDSSMIEAVVHPRLTRQIRMRGLKPPTVARWASFGWTVVEVSR